MAIEELAILREELPELFQDRRPVPGWDDAYVKEPVEPESLSEVTGLLPDVIWDDTFWLTEEIEPAICESKVAGSASEETMDGLVEIFGGNHGGAPAPWVDRSFVPPPEWFAFYLPYHYYYDSDLWGVYLTVEGVSKIARYIQRWGRNVDRSDAWRAAELFLYYHEAFHHCTECFATRLEITHRHPLYKTGFEPFFISVQGTADWLEEGLANAHALRHVDTKLRTWKSHDEIMQALEMFVEGMSPGYDRGVEFYPESVFMPTRCDFAEENQRTCMPRHPHKSSGVWRTTPYMFNGIANIKSRVNYLIPAGSPLASRIRLRA